MENETAQPQKPTLVVEEAPVAVPTPKKKFPLIVFIIFLVLGLAAGGIYLYTKQQSLQTIKSYEGCTKAGYPATLSYPSTCRTPDGRQFVQTVSPIASPDSTSDWKTYTNSEYSFSFKYPPSSVFSEPQLVPDENANTAVYRLLINFGYDGKVSLDAAKEEIAADFSISWPQKEAKEKPLSLQESAQNSRQSYKKSCPQATISEISDLQIAGTDAKKFSVSNCLGDRQTSIYFVLPGGERFLIVQDFKNKESLSQYQLTFDQILSTFKFLDQNQTDTTGWKTYTNENCKVQLKYPSGWKVVKDCVERFDCIETNDFNGSIGATMNTKTTGTAVAVSCSTEGQPTSNEKLLQSCLKDKEKVPTNICQKVTFGTTEFVNTLKGSYFSYSDGTLYTINIEPVERVDTSKSELDQILSTFKFL